MVESFQKKSPERVRYLAELDAGKKFQERFFSFSREKKRQEELNSLKFGRVHHILSLHTYKYTALAIYNHTQVFFFLLVNGRVQPQFSLVNYSLFFTSRLRPPKDNPGATKEESSFSKGCRERDKTGGAV